MSPRHGADRVLRPGRAGRYLDPDRELHQIPVRHLGGRAREPCSAAGETARRRDRRDPAGRQHRPGRADRHAGRRRRSPSEDDRPHDGCRVAAPRGDSLDRFVGFGLHYGAARSHAALAPGKRCVPDRGRQLRRAARPLLLQPPLGDAPRPRRVARRRPQYRTEQIATKANISVETRSEFVAAAHGDEQLEANDVIDRRTDTTSRRDTTVLFVMIGAAAATDWLPNQTARDEHGFVLTATDAMKAGHWDADREPFAPLERHQCTVESRLRGATQPSRLRVQVLCRSKGTLPECETALARDTIAIRTAPCTSQACAYTCG